MNATPLLARVVAALREQALEAVLIGNAAAAIHGAPVTTLAFDFMFRDTPVNLRKLKRVAAELDAMILRPFYPVSKRYRVVNDEIGLQADFMPVIHGVRSFEGLRDRAAARSIAGAPLLVASLDDVIASKEAAGGQEAAAARRALDMSRSRATAKRGAAAAAARRRALAALGVETDRQLADLIRRRLALPLEKRMNFLRKRLPGGGSCL